MGGKLDKPGIFNAPPDLGKLDEGDVSYQIDFREIYASVLDNWLDVKHEDILKRSFKTHRF